MVKHTQTIRRPIADELFECIWPFSKIDAKRVIKVILIILLDYLAAISIFRFSFSFLLLAPSKYVSVTTVVQAENAFTMLFATFYWNCVLTFKQYIIVLSFIALV